MNPQERLKAAAQAVKLYNPNQLSIIDDYSVNDLARVAADQDISVNDMPKLVGVMIYMRHRLIEKKSRVAAFKIAFPERCVVAQQDTSNGKFSTEKEIGEQLSTSAIDIKAKRLESSQMYLKVYQLLQTNMYIAYAVDRMKVVEESLSIALDPLTPLRDKDRYMKLFLDETRKPESAKGLEVNFNLTQNNVTLQSVEDKLGEIASKLDGATAADVINAVYIEGSEDDSAS